MFEINSLKWKRIGSFNIKEFILPSFFADFPALLAAVDFPALLGAVDFPALFGVDNFLLGFVPGDLDLIPDGVVFSGINCQKVKIIIFLFMLSNFLK